MAITKADNKVSVDGSFNPYGGCVVALSYNVSFDGPSTMSVTIANETGEYDTPSLGDASSVQLGSLAAVDMIPTSYRKSMGSSGRTLTINYDDMSMEYLDKTLVLLNYKHVTDASSFANVIALGYMFAPSPDKAGGGFERFYGTYQGGVDVKYNLSDLAAGMGGIPMSGAASSALTSQGPSLANASDADVALQESFLRSETGTLRSVLAAAGGSLGVKFFWNTEGGGSGQLDVLSGGGGADIESYQNSCNVIDSAEDVSIKNCYVTGAIGSFSTTNTASRSLSEPYARFAFMDTIDSPYGGGSINMGGGEVKRMGEDNKKNKGNPLLYDLEMLMKAAAVSPEYYKRFILMKKLSQMFAIVGKGDDIENKIMDEKNQKTKGMSSKFLGKWFGAAGGGDKASYKNIARNKAVEKLYGDFTFLPSAYSGSAGVGGSNKQATVKNHSLAGFHFWVHIVEDKQFLSQCGTGKPWIGCIYKLGSLTDKIIDDISSEPVYKTIKFLSQNFGRYYYSVGGVAGSGETEKPALLTQRKVGGRNYAGRGPQWIFSDLAVSDSPYAALWAFTSGLSGATKDWSAGNYSIKKAGQASPSIVFLPSDVKSPLQRTFKAVGYANIQSIYDYVKYFPDDTSHPTLECGGREEGGSGTQTYTSSGGAGGFACEVYGSFSDTSIPKYSTTPAEGFTGRGGSSHPDPDASGSMSAEAYGTINEWRGSCKDGYRYPTDMDCGMLLWEAYSSTTEGVVENPPAFTNYDSDTIEELFSVEGSDGFPEGGSGGIGAFVIQVPNEMPENAPQKEEWGDGIEPDFVDLQLYKVALPFSLASITDRIRLSYTYPKDDRLLTFRASCIPSVGENACSFDVKNVSFDVSELQPETNNFGTEFPKCREGNSIINLQSTLGALDSMVAGYVEEQLSPASSHEFTVIGFGFGDDNTLPTVSEGLESLNISVGANGVITKIKIGNTRAARGANELRKSLTITDLAGAPMARTKQGSVTTSFSNSFRTSL